MKAPNDKALWTGLNTLPIAVILGLMAVPSQGAGPAGMYFAGPLTFILACIYILGSAFLLIANITLFVRAEKGSRRNYVLPTILSVSPFLLLLVIQMRESSRTSEKISSGKLTSIAVGYTSQNGSKKAYAQVRTTLGVYSFRMDDIRKPEEIVTALQAELAKINSRTLPLDQSNVHSQIYKSLSGEYLWCQFIFFHMPPNSNSRETYLDFPVQDLLFNSSDPKFTITSEYNLNLPFDFKEYHSK